MSLPFYRSGEPMPNTGSANKKRDYGAPKHLRNQGFYGFDEFSEDMNFNILNNISDDENTESVVVKAHGG